MPRPKEWEGQPPHNVPYRDVTQIKDSLKLRPATVPPITESKISIATEGDWRILESNTISEHNTGEFPNNGNPNTISEQPHTYRVPANPQLASKITEGGWVFGLAINGVPFDPGAGEFYHGDPRLGWMYDALSGAIDLGFDENHAHVQPEGTYHYHGLPTLLLDDLKVSPEKHSPLVGWAADGFPIYALYGYENGKTADSEIVTMTSSYRLKTGDRPGGDEPDGTYDGTFVRDYEYIEGAGTLDECNGRMTVTPEFPDGTYAYFLTSDFPIVPRCFKGTPSQDFAKGRPPR
ncbi:MAG: YHYH protein [Cyanobacteria bacterium J06638_38]